MLNPLYNAVTWILLSIHKVVAPLFGTSSGVTWGLSIVLLTVALRLLLFPLFVKQIKTQRTMTELQPQVKALQAKYKGDREKLNQEMMALYREHKANPLMGCLPLVLQMPVFFALFHVLRSIANVGKAIEAAKTDPSIVVNLHYGWTHELAQSAANAKIFGVPLALGFTSPANLVRLFGANPSTVKIVTVIGILIMAATTFITQRQMISRNAASGNPMAQQQKIMLYVLPPMFAVFGLAFPMGVLLYWVTSNTWSMGQQHFVIKAMHAKAPGGAGQPGGVKGAPAPAAAPPVVIRRQQPTRQARSKRAGKKR